MELRFRALRNGAIFEISSIAEVVDFAPKVTTLTQGVRNRSRWNRQHNHFSKRHSFGRVPILDAGLSA
jgi:hypothetical protein